MESRTNYSERIQIISETILEMEKPFMLTDLFFRLEEQGIVDKALILHILNHLCDAGFVDYSEYVNDYFYVSSFALQ